MPAGQSINFAFGIEYLFISKRFIFGKVSATINEPIPSFIVVTIFLQKKTS